MNDSVKAPPANALTPSEPDRYLVFGASGYIGTNLVPYLLAAGLTVRAAARSPEVLEGRGWQGVELIAADATKPETLAPALAGVRAAYYLVHSMAAGKRFGDIDLEAARHFADAAAQAGVERIIYLGGLVPPAANTEHIVSRRQTGDVLRSGSVPVTEIRAGIIVGPGSAAFEVMRDLVFHLPMMVTPRWVLATSPPIALDNLLEYLRRVPELPETAGQIFDTAGPDYLTYRDMMLILAEEAGRRRPIIVPVPLLTPKLSSYWLHLITSVPTPIARALIEGMRQDFHADSTAIERLIPQHLLDFRSAVRAAFAAERRHSVAARWTEGAFVFRDYRPDYAFYAKRASGYADANASPEQLWAVIRAIGGSNRYFYANFLWKLREILDWLLGGNGMNYGRRHPTELRIGDVVDSWRVIGLEPNRRLTLFFGMRAPGSGVLEFALKPLDRKTTDNQPFDDQPFDDQPLAQHPEQAQQPQQPQTRIEVTAYWHPAGIWGLLYWYALVPAHLFLFKGLTRAIAKRAEQIQTRGTPSE